MRTKPWMVLIGVTVGICCFFDSPVLAQDLGKRSKALNFEDDVIEGINRKPLDSVNQISENNKRKREHLYRKRSNFSDRDRFLIQTIAGGRS